MIAQTVLCCWVVKNEEKFQETAYSVCIHQRDKPFVWRTVGCNRRSIMNYEGLFLSNRRVALLKEAHVCKKLSHAKKVREMPELFDNSVISSLLRFI